MSTIGESMNTFGYCTVIAFTKRSGPRTRPASAAGRESSPVTVDSLGRHFTEIPDSQLALAAAASDVRPVPVAGGRGGGRESVRAPARRPEDSSTRIYPNLGIAYGTVDRAGLAALRADPTVGRVTAAPQLSLIRPVASAAARLTDSNTWGIDALGVPDLWARGLTGAGVRIAHLDTGVDATHPALRSAIAAYVETDLSGREIPGATARDSDAIDGHGTHTAATIAGRPVNKRHVGVAPGAELYTAMVIEGGDIVARILGGMDWAVGQNVRILSMSLGIRGLLNDFLGIVDTLRDNGVLPVMAAGNEGPGTSRSPGNYPKALSVGAHGPAFDVPGFSSSQRFPRRSQPLVPDVVAPGVDVISATPGGSWRTLSGSSMAVPHVAGIAALLLEASPDLTVAKLERAIFASAERGTMPLDRANRGGVHAVRALASLG